MSHQSCGALPQNLREALFAIQPSVCGDLEYRPCTVTLNDGRISDVVYVVAEKPYIEMWGIWPEDDTGKRSVRIEDVASLAESPTRLPARFANQLYNAGESGMGYTVFTIVFADGQKQACITGNAVDFIRYPEGKEPTDVVSVIPHEGRRDDSLVRSPEYYWCLYSE